MALIGAIDDFGDGIVRNFGNVGMTVTAFNLAMNAVIVNCFVNIVIPSFAVFIYSADKPVFVAHEAVVFIGRVCLGIGNTWQEDSGNRQPCDDMLLY